MIKVMTTKNFNAKKMLMSTVAAVVFSFVFTTNANALPSENTQGHNLEVRVKGCANAVLYPLYPKSSMKFLAYEYSDLLL